LLARSELVKRAFWLPGALVIFAAALLSMRGVVAQSDAVKPGWEYKVFLVVARDFRDKDDWKEILDRAGGNEFRADADFKAYVLNHFANDGWELIQVVQPLKDKSGGGEIVHFYMKRPRREEEKKPEDANPPPRKPR
jgi:hypothetical protein